MVHLEVFLVLLESEIVIVEITALPKVTVPATDVTPFVSAFLLRFEARLAVAFAIFAPNQIVHRLRISGRNLAVLGNDLFLEVFIVTREQVSHKLMDLRLVG